MATLVLGAVGAAVGGSLGGSLLGVGAAVIGRAVGATVGRGIDQSVLGAGADALEVGRIDRLRLTGASEGAVIPRVVGRVRVGGQVIWATRFRENRTTSGGSGKGGPKPPKQTTYSYSISIALALCEGEITRIGRIWADGAEIARDQMQIRLHNGGEDQLPDSLIEAIEGAGRAPAFRGTAYIVIEDLDLTPFGNRVPNFSFEVLRTLNVPGEVPAASNLIEGVAIVPGTGEYSLATTLVHFDYGGGLRDSANVNSVQGVSDFRVSLRDLTEELPNLKSASLIVSWFGNDLRCGSCTIRPRVESREVDGSPMPWSVRGLLRERADVVPLVNDRPVYGGTPSDASVVEAIRALNDANVDVTFYPFILMDQLAGNGLPDPWGASEQPILPWRGRITSSVAPGREGTVDRSEMAEKEVARFFGPVGDSGPESGEGKENTPTDWSYQKFILHYARLCADAGGVEAFCIGSEMIGLTQIRGAGDTFPAVEALRKLARDVKKILPDAKIGYAADWSEYFGYHPSDSENLHFHLDPLWADPSIDFVGIDNYMPLSDWRDGDGHSDAARKSIHSLDYLRDNVEGGEGFDWYYRTPMERAAQKRSEITDDAYGEPWVWRYKDVRNWWANSHHERIDGVRSEQPTDWSPGSKPIRFTEYGCAAIDKGANQPNKFIDEKSSESSLPFFSNGRRDDTMQAQYLRALLDYWGGGARNPDAQKYDGKMIDLAHSFAWAWDARPWPFFPELKEFWTDGANYDRGHWISGRTGNQPLATVIADICRGSGVHDFDVSQVFGTVRGYAVSNVQAARADLQPLLIAHAVEASEFGGKLVFSMRGDATLARVDVAELVRGDDPSIKRQRAPEAEVPRRVMVHHTRAGGDFEMAMADATLPGTATLPISETEMPLMLTRGEAQALAERMLAETQIVRDTIDFGLAPSRRDVAVGSLVSIDGSSDIWRVDRLEDAGPRKVQAVRTERGLFEPSDEAEDEIGRVRPRAPLPVDATVLDLPLLTGEDLPHAPYIAVSAQPWLGPVALHSSVEDSDYRFNTLIDGPSMVGVTVTELLPATPAVWDNGPDLLVRFTRGSLSALSRAALFAGGNAAAIGTGDPRGWEVFQFKDARLIGPDTWALSGRLRGQRGTERWGIRPWPAGSRVVILDESLTQIDLPRESVGIERTYRIGPANLPVDNESYRKIELTANAEGLRPYPPVHLTVHGDPQFLVVSWIRRSRHGWASGWEAADVPLAEASEAYRVRLTDGDGNLLLEERTAFSQWSISQQRVAELPSRGSGIQISVAQISDAVGAGGQTSVRLR